mmetsp:Transcript_27239/g.79781  ORF Transcript_27239/g.79781 Transcript_27239/m.79781 type:complete len:287 (+) Transcript_27239:32-892(+)
MGASSSRSSAPPTIDVLQAYFLGEEQPSAGRCSTSCTPGTPRWHHSQQRQAQLQQQQRTQQSFDQIDRNGDGSLLRRELARAAVITDQQAAALMASFDRDGNGVLDVLNVGVQRSAAPTRRPGDRGKGPAQLVTERVAMRGAVPTSARSGAHTARAAVTRDTPTRRQQPDRPLPDPGFRVTRRPNQNHPSHRPHSPAADPGWARTPRHRAPNANFTPNRGGARTEPAAHRGREPDLPEESYGATEASAGRTAVPQRSSRRGRGQRAAQGTTTGVPKLDLGRVERFV